MKKYIFFLFFTALQIAFAQERKLTIPESVIGFTSEGSLYPKTFYNLQRVEGTDHFAYRSNDGIIFISAETGKEVKRVGNELQGVYHLTHIPWINYIDANRMIFEIDHSFKIYDYNTNKPLVSITLPKEATHKDFNEKQNRVAYTIDNNLYIADERSEKIVVTQHTNANIVAGQAIHRSEFGIKKGTFWSPKGNLLAFYQKDETHVTDYPLVDITSVPASSKLIKYPMAGQKSERASVGIYNIDTQKLVYLDIDTSDEHYLTNLSWTPDEKYVLIAEINRDQNQYWLNRYDVATGKKINTLFEEKNDKWVEPEHQAVFLPNSNTEFLWMSERNGFMNLYHYNLNGKLIKQITNFKWVVDEILGFDATSKHVFISGTGNDARQNHTFKINIKNPKKITALTTVPGTHKTHLSWNGKYLLDTYSSVTIPQVIEIIQTETQQKKTILKSENPLEKYAVGTTELIELKANDGTPLYAKMHKPKDFDPSKIYPVLVYVYGGPHAQLVTNSWLAGSYLWMPVFAHNQKYIVFTLDNRGSANRGFAFESGIHRQLGELEMEDQLTGINYLKTLPYVDSGQIAVHGWSFGGFMASSLMLRHPGVFSTAVAGGAVTDWAFYEVMYGERYMDTPQSNPNGYEKSRISNYVSNLKGKILFIHGSVDDVVVPQHVLTLMRTSVSQKQFFDFFLYPMHAHNVSGYDHVNLVQRILDYIVEHNVNKKYWK
ncbi:S9 family peptidase [Capnocytophaga canimorsus]|uniref:S9 family peptidase n=1 Tax=Capnocytophaga canimorsus TaxID=28188 RepID=UPI000D6E0153|nr:DPP IV N-terminal domain-containing protein [Capnocytophaga canimorsus]AWL78348.1 S9 family peptidase [Capnocytophaga canimorsus]